MTQCEVSDLLGLDWTGSGLKSSPLQFYRDLAPGAPYNPYTIYSKSWRPFSIIVGSIRTYQIWPKSFILLLKDLNRLKYILIVALILIIASILTTSTLYHR